MKICKSFFIIFALTFAAAMATAQYTTRAGAGGVTVTPRGINFNDRPELKISQNSFVVKTTQLDIPLAKAKEILQNTNLITGASLGDKGEISRQALAFASILYYRSRESAQLALGEIFNFAKYPEGRAYAMMGLYYFGGKDVLNKLMESCAKADKDKAIEIAVLMNSTLHRVESAKFFDTFLKNTQLFIPQESVLARATTVEERAAPPVYISRPPVIIQSGR